MPFMAGTGKGFGIIGPAAAGKQEAYYEFCEFLQYIPRGQADEFQVRVLKYGKFTILVRFGEANAQAEWMKPYFRTSSGPPGDSLQ